MSMTRRTRVSGDDRAALTRDVVARYDQGEPIRTLAESLSRSYGFVHRLLVEGGVELRGRGGARSEHSHRL